jgi:hypothetical protein
MLITGTVRRLFWVSLGASAGVLVYNKLTKAAQELTPAGIADRVSGSGSGMFDSVKSFFEDVRELAHDREEELNVALGIDVPPTGEEDGTSKKARAI